MNNRGFTLIEMAVVLIILGLLITTFMSTFTAQRELQMSRQTTETLDNAHNALIAFAQTQGRLPCPATATSHGIEAPIGGGACTAASGFLPAATLGLQPMDADGYLLDAWDSRVRYAVAQSNSGGLATADFTTTGDITNIATSALVPELRVCMSSTGTTATQCSSTPETNFLINNAVAVVFSMGPSWASPSGGADETENTDGDTVFVSHDPTVASATNGEFDHRLVWISPFTLYNAMIQAGQPLAR